MLKVLRFFWIGLLLGTLSCRSPEEKRALAIGMAEITTQNFGWLLPKVERVDLYALNRNATNGAFDTFPVHYMDEGAVPVTNHIVLEGADAEEFATKWRKLQFWWAYASLCHEPGFGIRFSSEGKPSFETAVCLQCSDFSFKTKLGPQLSGFSQNAPATVAFSNALARRFVNQR
jgi:hypothetical protein